MMARARQPERPLERLGEDRLGCTSPHDNQRPGTGSQQDWQSTATGDMLYRIPIQQVQHVWRKHGEGPREAIQRIQKQLGPAFTEAWHQYVRRYTRVTPCKMDPFKNSEGFCVGFLKDVQNHDYDVRQFAEHHGMDADWSAVGQQWKERKNRKRE